MTEIVNRKLISIKDRLNKMGYPTRMGSSNSAFVKLEHEVLTKWQPAAHIHKTQMTAGEWDALTENVAKVLEDLDHCQGGWKYSLWAGHDKTGAWFYAHSAKFSDKGEALMFKLRMR